MFDAPAPAAVQAAEPNSQLVNPGDSGAFPFATFTKEWKGDPLQTPAPEGGPNGAVVQVAVSELQRTSTLKTSPGASSLSLREAAVDQLWRMVVTAPFVLENWYCGTPLAHPPGLVVCEASSRISSPGEIVPS